MPARSLALPLCAIAIAWSHVASAAPLDLAGAIETEKQGSALMISWDAPADDVWSVVEKLADRWDQKRKEWQRAHGGKGGCPCGGGDCQGCDKCRAGECPMMNKDGAKKGGEGKSDGALRDDEF